VEREIYMIEEPASVSDIHVGARATVRYFNENGRLVLVDIRLLGKRHTA